MKTALEHFVEKLNHHSLLAGGQGELFNRLLEEAKEIERQQIIDGYLQSSKDNSNYNELPKEDLEIEKSEAEQYYTTT